MMGLIYHICPSLIIILSPKILQIQRIFCNIINVITEVPSGLYVTLIDLDLRTIDIRKKIKSILIIGWIVNIAYIILIVEMYILEFIIGPLKMHLLCFSSATKIGISVMILC